MMLEHLGEIEAARHLEQVMSQVLVSGICTPDLGGGASTSEVTGALLSRI